MILPRRWLSAVSYALVALTMTCLSLTLGSCESSTHTDPVRPNIVIIMADDLGFGDLSGYGAIDIVTPNSDRLIREGRRFTDAHSPSSVCTPTRYGLLTGRYAWRGELQSGVYGSSDPLLIEMDRMTIPSYLKTLGYSTGCVGKWHLGFGDDPETDWNAPLSPGPLDTGFDYYFGVPTSHNLPPFVYVENLEVLGRLPGEIIEIVDDVEISGIADSRIDDEVGPTLTSKAVEFIDDHADSPFFLYVPTASVHFPITPAEFVVGTSAVGSYGDFVHEFDWTVGQILDALDANGIADNTLVIVTSDNGAWPFFSCDTGHLPNGSLRGGKASLFEGGHRVPFIARWPGWIPPGTESNETISLTDLLATIIDITGGELPNDAGEDSFSIASYLWGEPPIEPIRDVTIHHSLNGKFAIRSGQWKYIPEQDPILTRTWLPRGISCEDPADLDEDHEPEQLYNLETDLSEEFNVVDQFPELASDLAQLLEEIKTQGHSRRF